MAARGLARRITIPKSRLLLIVAGLAVSLAVAAGALAATMVFDNGDSNDETTSAGLATSKPTPSRTPTAVAGDAPDGVPQELWARLQALPDKLRGDLVRRLQAGSIALNQIETAIEDYANRNQAVRVGTVIDATDSMLSLEVYTTGEKAEVALNSDTVLRRGNSDIKATDLEPDELVLVISRDGGETAFAVEAFGVSPP
jgi:hypothetical protein